jgi:hypothetical protein
MEKKITIVICICIVFAISFFSGCINVPEELTQFSIVSFDVEPGIINQGEFANLSWVVISAASVNIDNGIGSVALTGHRILQPTQTTTYMLTASKATTTKSATVTITVNDESNESYENQEIIISSFEIYPGGINPGESAYLTWVVTGATSVTIDNGIGNVALSGNQMIWPTETTTYTLTASNANICTYANVTIYVIPEQPTITPNMAFNKQTTPAKGLTLVHADSGLYWKDFLVVGNSSGPAKTDSVTAGDWIGLSGTTGTITITHIPTNTLMGTWTWA